MFGKSSLIEISVCICRENDDARCPVDKVFMNYRIELANALEILPVTSIFLTWPDSVGCVACV